MNFFTNWLKKSPTKKEQPKHFETSVETLLSTSKCGCGETCKCASLQKPKPVVKKTPVAKKPSTATKPTATPKPKVTKLEQVKADAERMAKKPAPKKPKAK